MEPADTLTTLFRHNLWANLRLLESCSELTPEQLNAKIIGSRGSILDTLLHIVNAEQSYLARISTGRPRPRPGDTQRLTIAELGASLRTTGSGFIEWASRVQAEDTVQIDWDGTPRNVPKTIILVQVITHATEHREQIKIIMTQLGIDPPDLQSWSYFDEQIE